MQPRDIIVNIIAANELGLLPLTCNAKKQDSKVSEAYYQTPCIKEA